MVCGKVALCSSCHPVLRVHERVLSVGTRFDIPGWASADSYWAGFYTSRPQLKGWARNYDGLLHGTELALSVATTSGAAPASDDVVYEPDVDATTGISLMRRISGVLKHHDAETGACAPLTCELATVR